MSQDMFEEIPIKVQGNRAAPISYRLPGTTTIHPMDTQEAMQRCYKEHMEKMKKGEQANKMKRDNVKKPNLNSTFVEPQSLTVEERKYGWVEESRVRPSDGRIEKFYYHLPTNKQFRSLLDVYGYIKYCDATQRDSEGKRLKGDTLLKKQIIGNYDFKTGAIIEQREQSIGNAIDTDMEVEPSAKGDGTTMIMETEEETVDEAESMIAKNAREEDKNNKRKPTEPVSTIGRYMSFEFIQ